jgi:hypothetical protein
MTLTEKQAWASLVATIAIAAYFIANMTDGWVIPDQEPRHLWRTWIFVLVAGTAAEAVIGVQAARGRAKGDVEDERDWAVVRQADRIGMVVGYAGVNVLVWQLLWQSTLIDRAVRETTGPIIWPDLTHLPTLILLLMGLLFLTHLVKQAAIIVLGRL